MVAEGCCSENLNYSSRSDLSKFAKIKFPVIEGNLDRERDRHFY